MEKIISINMAGRVIAIEDGAYTTLKAYLESLHQYFAGEEGRDEIINDIESRVAELMEAAIKRGSAAITEADVAAIMDSMGRVEDFAAAEDEPAATSSSRRQSQQAPKRSRRFNRDTNDKIAGGVCSGLASYLNVDPALVRIVFAILTICGWGAGMLLYIVLWIFVPAAPLERFRGRRLFRNEADKWIGGVCSGLGAYFEKEAWVFRIVFASPILLNIFSGTMHLFPYTSFFFGSLTGAFFLIYVVLWVVLPLARSDFEKMEMRGEKIDLASIRQNVYAGASDLKGRVRDWSGEVSQSASSFVSGRGRDFAREAAAAARPMASRGAQAIGIVIKAFFLFFGGILAFSLFVMLIGYAFGGFSDLANDFILRTPAQRALGWATVILCLGVPLTALVTYIARRALRIRGGRRYLSLGFTALWISGLVCAAFLAATLAHAFNRTEHITGELPILQPTGGRLILAVPGTAIEYSNSLPMLHGDIHGWDLSGDTMYSAAVGVVTKLSPDSLFHIVMTRYSSGTDAAEARSRAAQISYAVRNERGADSLVSLNTGYTITKGQGYRGQNIVLEVQVPAGRRIRFDESVADKLIFTNLFNRRNYRRQHGWNIGWEYSDWQEWEPGVDYVMNAKGELTDPLNPDDDDKPAVAVDVQKMEAHGRKVDSLNRALEAIERQKDALEAEDDDE